jgi:hypothetical protein
MSIHVRDEVLKKTDKCTKHLRCLSGDIHHLCRVTYSEDLDRFFCVDTRGEPFCPYRLNGHTPACSCPIRQELLVVYGI